MDYNCQTTMTDIEDLSAEEIAEVLRSLLPEDVDITTSRNLVTISIGNWCDAFLECYSGKMWVLGYNTWTMNTAQFATITTREALIVDMFDLIVSESLDVYRRANDIT